MTDAGTTQDNFILPVQPVGGLPLSQDWLDSTTVTFTFHKQEGRKKGNVLFNDTLNTFYLRLYGVGHMVKDHYDSKKRNPLPPHT